MMQWVLWPVLGVLVLICAIGTGYKSGHEAGTHEIQGQWDEERAQAAIKFQELQANMDKLRESKSRETARLSATVRALTDSLRDRPDRPTDAASSAGNGAAGCTGAELYKPDGEFLVRESSRADTLRLALIQCQAAYQAVSK